MASKPKPIMKASPAFLKEIKTDPALVQELLATIAKRNKVTTQTRPTCIQFRTIEPDKHSEFSISSTLQQAPTLQPALAHTEAYTISNISSQATTRKTTPVPKLRQPLLQGIREIICGKMNCR